MCPVSHLSANVIIHERHICFDLLSFLGFHVKMVCLVYLTVCSSACSSACLSVCLPGRLVACLSACLSLPPVCLLCICLSVCLFIFLSAVLSACRALSVHVTDSGSNCLSRFTEVPICLFLSIISQPNAAPGPRIVFCLGLIP